MDRDYWNSTRQQSSGLVNKQTTKQRMGYSWPKTEVGSWFLKYLEGLLQNNNNLFVNPILFGNRSEPS